ncbi:DUF1427 family protein [Paucibacter sp. R3-3]|uniref:DUF1427 family protein n=1 Tax=Roseateles agri TaxID=3098619 RepID=A0ABU5DL05_9BURK|nr:DUF1427 family protein [Paucibacter sp. R3-3]MDY0746388.1 DUF1427 family protein [Paucibacter sp. R3-3]
MSPQLKRRLKLAAGLVLGVAIGATCRACRIPSPAPPVLAGALLVVSMTLGYLAMDRFCTRAALHAGDCAGPDGGTAGPR